MQKKKLEGFLFCLPALILAITFFIFPLLRVFIMSFQEWNPLGGSKFVGLSNYIEILESKEFWQTLWNTTIYTIIVTPMIFLPAILLATGLRKTTSSSKIFRTIFFLPVAISFVVASYVWLWIYNDTYGILNYILMTMGFLDKPIAWLDTTWKARVMVSIMIAWKTQGFTMMILLAGLQSIPAELYEAAKIDGAGRFQLFRYITLPLLRPTLVLSLIISIAGSFKAFDHFYIMTGGGPMKTTQTMVMYINKVTFEYYKVGLGAAASVIFLIMLLVISTFQLKIGGFSHD